MTAPCIITVAITGSLPQKRDNPAVPITVQEQIESTHEAIEAFDLSMIFPAANLQQRGLIPGPLHVQFVMGIRNAMPVDREVLAFYVRTLQRVAPGATWTGAGIGRDQMTMARWSLELGGHCRTGMEDNVRLDKDTLAPSNPALVRAVVRLCEAHGRPVASARQARELLRLH